MGYSPAVSYSLVVWEGPAPASDEEARAACDRLLDEYHAGGRGARPATAAMAAFASALLRRWPDIGDTGGEDSPWSDAPLADNFSGSVAVIGIVASGLADAVPFVVREAARRKLVCFDPQGPPYVRHPERSRDRPARIRDFRTRVAEALTAQGYVRHGDALVIPIDSDLCWVVQVGRGCGDDVSPGVAFHHHGVERLVSELLELAPPGKACRTAGQNAGCLIDGTYRDWIDASSGIAYTPGTSWIPGSVEDVLSAIAKARAVLSPFLSLERIPGATEINGVRTMSPFSLVATHLLLADEGSACQCLAQVEMTECRQEGPVCEQYRRFERNALSRMTAEAPALLEQAKAEAQRSAPPPPSASLLDRLLRRVSKLPPPVDH
jgi:hypothetical protein